MTTAADREDAELLAAYRRADRQHARHVLAGLAAGHHLTPAQTRQLLDMVGLIGDPEDDGVPVVMPHAFNEPNGPDLRLPASGTYR